MPETIRLRLTGVAPLLMHSGRLADPLDPYAKQLARLTAKRAKTDADLEEIARVEWTGGLWLADGAPCVPAEALEAAIVQAGKARRAGSLMRAAMTVRDSMPIEHDGPAEPALLWADAAYRHRCGVRIGARTTIRTRPRFDRWAVTATLRFEPSIVDSTMVTDLARHAGDLVGLGDWRPRFGRFRVDVAT
ncbi:hypothetical protein [Lichenibacterium ramalinae]|uniref:Uncharacterized protein n=1 Tax=Lichenibacterium ramalinae TaxID=2316527 RepID=A0A4Q2RCH6_9HYPH|nr:hypothetical protein [Lichenibacterium ramalinae]RYB04325.1 hypothetical protein D3272_12755 [Lichenibacterium ramalinae]